MTRILRNALFSLLLAGLVLGGLEGIARLVRDPGLYAGDPGSVWTLRADLPPRSVPFPERATSFTVRTNAHGYRGGPAPEGAILCLGDSTTFGWGVEEAEAWPARLSALLGRAVVNGGVPGYSTAQGVATLDHALSLHPRAVLLAYLVRDAERAAGPDSARAASTLPDLALLRLFRTARDPRPLAAGVTFRVPPEAYEANLRALRARIEATGAAALLFAFPMATPPDAHLAVLDRLGAPAPDLSDDVFFPEDPIHLTPQGHDTLTRWVASTLPIP